MIRAACLAFIAAFASTAAQAQSTINPALPANGQPYSASVIRGQFDSAYNDINALTRGVAPSVTSTFQLTQTSTVGNTNGVLRLGYVTAGDAPPLLYLPSGNACTANAGAGDGGNQIPSSNGKCWLAVWPDPSRIDIREWGAVADDATDVMPYIVRAFNARVGRIYVPGDGGVWRVNSAGVFKDWPLQLVGDYPQELQGGGACPTGKPAGTWFHIANPSAQFVLAQGSIVNATQGTDLSNFGICQDHPTPGGGWAPNVYVPVFDSNATQAVHADKIFWYGVYDAYKLITSARWDITNQRGQVFRNFWVGDNLLDIQQWSNWHIWPFWSDDSNVTDWQIANGKLVQLGHVDGLQANNIFTISTNTGFEFQNSGIGTSVATAINVTNYYCDACKYAIHTNSGLTAAPQGAFSGVVFGGESVAASEMVFAEAGSTNISINGYYCLAAKNHCIDVTGQNAFITISGDYNLNYDTGNTGKTALYANSSNVNFPAYIYTGIPPNGSPTPPSTAVLVDNTTANGFVVVGGWITRDVSSTLSLSFGLGTTGITYGARSATYMRNLFTGEQQGHLSFTLTNKGSSTGAAAVTTSNSIANAFVGGGTVTAYANMSGVTGAVVCNIPNTASICSLDQQGAAATAHLDDTNFTNTSSMSITWSRQ